MGVAVQRRSVSPVLYAAGLATSGLGAESAERSVAGGAGVGVRRNHLRVVPSVEAAARPRVAGRGERHPRAMFARRRFAALCLLFVVLGGALLAGRAMATPEPGGRGVSVTVKAGETLSDIAAREMPRVPTSQAVVELQRANDLGSLHLDVGERLVIPGA